MVEKVVPLGEDLRAALHLAQHQAVPAIRAWVFKLDRFELLGLGNVACTNLELIEVNLVWGLNHIFNFTSIQV